MISTFRNILGHILAGREPVPIGTSIADPRQPLQAIGINDFLSINVPAREMLLSPILPERSLAMLYAPRGIGKSWLSLSIGMAVAAGAPLLRWSSPRQLNVLYVDGEMPLVSLQERLRAISTSMGVEIPNHGFRMLAADQIEAGIKLGTEEGQQSLEPLLEDIDFLIIDNLSTLCATGSESAGDAWVPMQNWLLKLRRQGVSVLLVHHAGTNGRQRGTSRCEDALDTVIALRRPEDYSPEQGARFEIHFEKLRNFVGGAQAMPFEAMLETGQIDGNETIRWLSCDLKPPMLMPAAELFSEGMTVRQVAAALHISKSEAGRLRRRALTDGILVIDADGENDDGSSVATHITTIQ
jgi:putative DNA primase/helicase